MFTFKPFLFRFSFICDSGRADIVRILIEHGAEVNAKQKTGLTPLHLAALKGNCLCFYFQKRLLFNFNLFTGHVEVVRLLIKRGVDVDAKEMHEYTPIHLASQNGNYSRAKGKKGWCFFIFFKENSFFY